MTRTQIREHIFIILFGVEFHKAEELDEHIALYMDNIGAISKKDLDYITKKSRAIISKIEEIAAEGIFLHYNSIKQAFKGGK